MLDFDNMDAEQLADYLDKQLNILDTFGMESDYMVSFGGSFCDNCGERHDDAMFVSERTPFLDELPVSCYISADPDECRETLFLIDMSN